MSSDLWLEDGPTKLPTTRRRNRVGIVLAAALCLIVVAVPAAIIASGGSGTHTSSAKSSEPSHVGKGTSAPQLLHALNATTGTGNFDVTYTFGGQDPGSSPTTTTTICSPSGSTPVNYSGSAPGSATLGTACASGGPSSSQPVGGTAIIDVQPFAMVATSQVQGFGTIVLRDNGTDVWEEGGGNYGLSPGSTTSGPGSSLTGFAGLVEGTLGPRQGALAMLGLASPTGYLNLDPAETSSASLVGTGTVSGTPVDMYQIFQTPGQGAQVPGLTVQEQLAVADAMQLLEKQGYTGSTVRVSVDAAGFIRRTQTTDHFADGTTMTSQAVFSNFGCAGTVLMPGQTGSSAPPDGCTSPDSPTATTVPPGSVPQSTVPNSGSSTTAPPTTAPSTTSPSDATSTTSPPPQSSTTSLPAGPTTTPTTSTLPTGS